MHHCKLIPCFTSVATTYMCVCYDNLVTTLLEYCICFIIMYANCLSL